MRERLIRRNNAARINGAACDSLSQINIKKRRNMKNLKLIEVYRRYVTSLADKNADLVKNYQAMDRFLREHCEDENLYGCLVMDILYIALCFINLNEVKLRDLSHGNWDSRAVKECYSKVKELKEASKEFDPSRFRILFTHFCKWVNGFEELPCLYLYCWQVYAGTNMGMFISNHRKLQEVIRHTEEAESVNESDADEKPSEYLNE